MTKFITITKQIPEPPAEYEYQDRQPQEGEDYLVWAYNIYTGWGWLKEMVSHVDQKHNINFAYRIKKKRLMTPGELAEGWLVSQHGAFFKVVCFGTVYLYLAVQIGKEKWTPKELHDDGWGYCDTPTGPRKSLEVDCD